ncbi:MAG: arginase family protein, partial [Actinomycetota bacterium]
MSTPPPYALPPTFLGTSRSDTGAAYCVVGIPFDLGVSVRPGARMAPTAIRLASRMLCDGRHPGHWSDPLALDLADLGDLRLPHGDVARSMAAIEQQVASLAHVVALGGDHTVTLPLLRALVQRTGPLGLVHFDAHPDTWPDTFGQSPSHGSVFFDAIAEGLIDCAASIQVGIR